MRKICTITGALVYISFVVILLINIGLHIADRIDTAKNNKEKKKASERFWKRYAHIGRECPACP